MKPFNDDTFTNILSSTGIRVGDYVINKTKYEDDLLLRLVNAGDHTKGYLELMFDNLVVTDPGEREKVFEEYLSVCNSCPGTYYTVVVEDLKRNTIIASGTLIIEQKFIHSCALRGRIENIMVHPAHRRGRVGSIVLGLLTFLAEKIGCYKTTLHVSDVGALLCDKLKYVREPGQNFMIIYFEKDPNLPPLDPPAVRGGYSKM